MAVDDRSGASGVVFSFLIGALSGAALAVLFAPRSGRETREMLGERLRDTAERGRHLGEEALERSRSLGEQAVEKGRELAHDAEGYVARQKEALEKRRERLSAAVEAGRQTYRDEKEKA
jgi:gas vesicle protein